MARRVILALALLTAGPSWADELQDWRDRAAAGRPASPGVRVTLPVPADAGPVVVVIGGRAALEVVPPPGTAYAVTVAPAGPAPPDDDGQHPDEIFLDELLAAYKSGPDPAAMNGLAAVYHATSADVKSGRVTTLGELFTLMKTKAKTLGVAGSLPAVQLALSRRLNDKIGDPTADPDKALPADAAAAVAANAQTLRDVAYQAWKDCLNGGPGGGGEPPQALPVAEEAPRAAPAKRGRGRNAKRVATH